MAAAKACFSTWGRESLGLRPPLRLPWAWCWMCPFISTGFSLLICEMSCGDLMPTGASILHYQCHPLGWVPLSVCVLWLAPLLVKCLMAQPAHFLPIFFSVAKTVCTGKDRCDRGRMGWDPELGNLASWSTGHREAPGPLPLTLTCRRPPPPCVLPSVCLCPNPSSYKWLRIHTKDHILTWLLL